MNTETNVEPGGSTGLLDNVSAHEETASNPQHTEIEHRSNPTDATASPEDPLERPDWWPENFWKKDSNEPDLEGMAKSWKDLRGKISKGQHNAPADGKYDVSSFGLQTADENPMASNLVGWAAENGLSQAQFDDLASKLRSTAESMMSSDMVDPKVEMEKLGPNAQAMIKDMVDWGRGLVKKGIWSPDEFEEFKIMGGTATGLRALMKVRETYEGRVPIQSAPTTGMPSKEELQAMVADPKYQTDPAYRQKVERLFHQAFG
jgi:hypothetical protein